MPTCPTCHSEFVRNGRQKHCSSKCRSKAGNAAKTARNRVKREGVSVAAPAHPAVKLPSPGKPVPCPLCGAAEATCETRGQYRRFVCDNCRGLTVEVA